MTTTKNTINAICKAFTNQNAYVTPEITDIKAKAIKIAMEFWDCETADEAKIALHKAAQYVRLMNQAKTDKQREVAYSITYGAKADESIFPSDYDDYCTVEQLKTVGIFDQDHGIDFCPMF